MDALARSAPRPPRREVTSSPRVRLLGYRALRALLLGAAVGGLLGGIAGTFAKKWYESSAQLAVIPIDDPTQPAISLEGASAALPMLTAVLQTGPIADEVVGAFGLSGVYGTLSVAESRAAFWKHVAVTSDRRSGIVRITAEDQDAKRAQQIAQALADAGMRRMTELWSAGPREQREKLEARLEESSESLAKAEQEMQRFRERTGIAEADEQRGGLPSLHALPRLQIEYARRKRAIDEFVGARDLLFRQIQQLRSVEARPLARIYLVDAPIESRTPARPRRLTLIFVGVIAVAGLAWLLEQLLANKRERRVSELSPAAHSA
jgi:uncharacterized protein involved in exopolysaccharide biosynthesis